MENSAAQRRNRQGQMGGNLSGSAAEFSGRAGGGFKPEPEGSGSAVRPGPRGFAGYAIGPVSDRNRRFVRDSLARVEQSSYRRLYYKLFGLRFAGGCFV